MAPATSATATTAAAVEESRLSWMKRATAPRTISSPAAESAVRRPDAGSHGFRSRSTTSVIASTTSS